MNKIAAIVVTYNRSRLLLECIEALRHYANKSDIIIVNNASTDDTEQALRLFIQNGSIMYYNTGKNIGGAGGFNYGLRKAYELGYKYFWLMDDDTIVCENTLKEIVQCVHATKGRFGFISSAALWIDGSECAMNKHKISRRLNHCNKLKDQGMLRVNQATFVSFFVNRKVVKEVGLPIKEYFIWGDDTEYSLRISNRYPSYYATNSKVLHKMGTNTSASRVYRLKDKDRIERLFCSVRNDVCTYKRNSWLQLMNATAWFLLNIIWIIIYRNPYKCLKIKTIVKGYVDGIIHFNPELEQIER